MLCKVTLLAALAAVCLAVPENIVAIEDVESDAATVVEAKGDSQPNADYQSDYYYRYMYPYLASRGLALAPWRSSKGVVLAPSSKGMALAASSKGMLLAPSSKGYSASLALAAMTSSKGGYVYSPYYMSPYYRKLAMDRMSPQLMECAKEKLMAEAPAAGSKGGLAFNYAPLTCSMPKVHGICQAYESRFYFNKDNKRCEEFIYGGCGGNTNNFETIEKCQSTCSCGLPAARGPCMASMPRFFFNSATGNCEKFTYGGCGGNANNYETEAECRSACRCRLPSETGLCRATLPRWYFNKESGECEVFIYGGCGGNANNYLTKKECEETC